MQPRDTQPMNQVEAAAILAEAARRKREREQKALLYLPRPREYIADLFAHQLALEEDPSTRKCGLTSRQAGKTAFSIRTMSRSAEDYPGCIVPFIGLTRRSAKLLIWNDLDAFNRKYNLGIDFNHTDLTAKFPNGSQILVTGASEHDDIAKLRGLRFPKVVVDEAAFQQKFLGELVDEVLDPATIAYNGTIILLSTPNASCDGYFFEATEGISPGWSTHKWTVLDNPFIPHAAEWLRKKREAKKWDETHPIYRREWLGEWIATNEDLVYAFERGRNTFHGNLPDTKDGWRFILGVDIGYEDPTSFVIGAFSYSNPNFYVVKVIRRSGMIPSAIAEMVNLLRTTYRITKIVIDQGGLGKAVAEEFKQRWHIPCEPAQKQKKVAFIDICNGDLKSGNILVHESCEPLIEELSRNRWDPERDGKEDERYPNDAADAFLYCYREARHFLHKTEKPEPVPGTPAHEQAMRQNMRRHAEGQVRRGSSWDREDYE